MAYKFSRRKRMDFAFFNECLNQSLQHHLHFIGGFRYESASREVEDTNGDTVSKDKTTTLTLDYGVGIEWWWASHISFVATATNALYHSQTDVQEDAAGNKTEDKTRDMGVVWDPAIFAAFVLWF